MHVHVSLGESVAVVWPTCLCPCLLVCLLACLLRRMFEFRPLSLGCFGTWSLRLICPRQSWHSTALRRSILSNSGCCGTRLLRWFAADRPLIGRSGFGAWLSRLVSPLCRLAIASRVAALALGYRVSCRRSGAWLSRRPRSPATNRLAPSYHRADRFPLWPF